VYVKGGEVLLHRLEDSVLHGSHGCSHVAISCILIDITSIPYGWTLKP
jgi:hypothetical protein